MLLFHNSCAPSIRLDKLKRPIALLGGISNKPFPDSRITLELCEGMQFVRHCAAPLRLCFFYNLRAQLEGTKSKVRYFWRIYLI